MTDTIPTELKEMTNDLMDRVMKQQIDIQGEMIHSFVQFKVKGHIITLNGINLKKILEAIEPLKKEAKKYLKTDGEL